MLRDLYRRQPNNPEVQGLLNVLVAAKKQDEAVLLFTKATALQPESASACNNLGKALYAQKDLAGAVAAHRQAIALQPDYARLTPDLGNALKTRRRSWRRRWPLTARP